jgi:TfoX/Sxy family transcriptional regulator of competence genes
MSKILKFDEQGMELLEQHLQELNISAEKKKMFGHESFFLNGYMFCGSNELGFFVHLGRDRVPELLESDSNLEPFRPSKKHAMKDYVQLNRKLSEDPKKARYWIRESADYLLSLDPKKK